MPEFLTPLAAWLTQHPQLIGACVAATALLESFFVIGAFMPGAVLLFALAALAGSLELPPLPLLVWAAAGAIAGDVSSFFIGRGLEHRLHDRPVMRRWQREMAAAHRFFERWGILSVMAGRFLGPARPFMPAIAGAAGMSRRVFIVTDVLTGVVWAVVYILPGYYSASAFA